ncbi:Sec-independent protein translocase protein TatB [Pendulispora albinea]|uniref:Sec-independent protein translocase protein TatB n=1 Tax=Pendulispora albinea TaxID=2741071 RepID=A0ABZ2LP59_9BACT
MFGLSFGELVVLIVVAVVVIGPRDLPKMLGKLGRFAGKMRRMAADLRHQSGIDEVLRAEGIQENIQEIRKLARGELDQLTEAARMPERPFGPDPDPAVAASSAASTSSSLSGSTNAAGGYAPTPYGGHTSYGGEDDIDYVGARNREYPREGADSGNAMPDTAFMYTEPLRPSPLASDPLYMTGDPHGVIPAPPPPPVDPAYPEESTDLQESHEPGEAREPHEPVEVREPRDLGAP